MEEAKRRYVIGQFKDNVDLKVKAELFQTSKSIAKNRINKNSKFNENMALQKCSYVLGILETLYMMGKISIDAKDWGYDYFTKVLVDEEIEKLEIENGAE